MNTFIKLFASLILLMMDSNIHFSEAQYFAEPVLDGVTMRKNITVNGGAWFVQSKNINNRDNFLYASCVKTIQPVETQCNVTITTPISLNNSKDNTCSLTLPQSKNVTFLAALEHFRDNQVILTWYQIIGKNEFHLSMGFSIVNMLDCVTHHLEDRYDFRVASNSVDGNPVLYDDGFDVYVSDKKMCGEGIDRCRISYDKNLTRQVHKAESFQENLNTGYVHPVSSASRSKGVFFRGWYDGVFKLMLASPNGTVTDLLTLKYEGGIERFVYGVSVASNNNNMYGVCWGGMIVQSEIVCAQFDADGNMKFKKGSVFGKYADNAVGVHNLPEGEGMLQFMLIDHSDGSPSKVYVRRIHGDGTEGTATSLNFSCHLNMFEMSVTQSGDDLDINMSCRNNGNSSSSLTLCRQHVQVGDLTRLLFVRY